MNDYKSEVTRNVRVIIYIKSYCDMVTLLGFFKQEPTLTLESIRKSTATVKPVICEPLLRWLPPHMQPQNLAIFKSSSF